MNNSAKNIVQQLFGVTSLSDVGTTEISQVASKHPYFGPIQFLLSQKMKETHNHEADTQLQKAALYFTNPYWLNYLLHENEIAEAETEVEENVGVANASFDEPLSLIEENKEQEETAEESKENFVPAVEDIIEPTEVVEEIEKDEIIPAIDVKHHEVVQETDEIVPAVEVTNGELQDLPDEIVPAIEVANDEVHDIPDEIVPAVEVPNDELHDSPDEIIPAVEVANDESHDATDEIIPAAEIENVEVDNTAQPEETDIEEENETQRLKLSSLIEQHLADFKKPVDENAELPIKSAPYHTVDYFASQGIKADGQDKLTSRVRKFTDWLKQMKGTTPQPTDLGTDAETEQMIETIAKTSNETKDIITEAMAEVLVKQGKTEKAIQLYKKLSFLNPAKSTYFAAKIDEINNK